MAFQRTWAYGIWQLLVEDDDRTCYAYLLCAGVVVSDTWISNRVRAATPEWTLPNARALMPFTNPVPFVDCVDYGIRELDREALNVDFGGANDAITVHIRAANEIVAVVCASTKPGWSALAMSDGPCARALSSRA